LNQQLLFNKSYLKYIFWAETYFIWQWCFPGG
jgi:hypothetical protein